MEEDLPHAPSKQISELEAQTAALLREAGAAVGKSRSRRGGGAKRPRRARNQDLSKNGVVRGIGEKRQAEQLESVKGIMELENDVHVLESLALAAPTLSTFLEDGQGKRLRKVRKRKGKNSKNPSQKQEKQEKGREIRGHEGAQEEEEVLNLVALEEKVAILEDENVPAEFGDLVSELDDDDFDDLQVSDSESSRSNIEENNDSIGLTGIVRSQVANESETLHRKSSLMVSNLEGESKIQKLDFNSECARIDRKIDDFVPRVGLTKEDFEKQKSLVADEDSRNKLMQEQEKRVLQKKLEKHQHVMEAYAAKSIQACARGFLARKNVKNLRNTANQDCNASSSSSDNSLGTEEAAWKLIFDEATGDKWYYNLVTKKSSWQIPDELGRLRKVTDDILPVIKVGKDHVARISSQNKEAEEALRIDENITSEKATNDKGEMEFDVDHAHSNQDEGMDYILDEDGDIFFREDDFDDDEEGISVTGSERTESTAGWSQSAGTPRFFLPDGTSGTRLRETVRHAIKEPKFGSVSSLLSNMAQEAKNLKKRTRRRSRRHQSEGLDLKTVVECATLSIPQTQLLSKKNNRVKGKRRRQQPRYEARLKEDDDLDGSQSVADESLPDFENNPVVRDVKFSGMREEDIRSVAGTADERHEDTNANEQKKEEICFLCWSAGDDLVKRCDEHQELDCNERVKRGKTSVLLCANWNLAALQRKYRAEEIQELFAKANASLRWDLNRKKFVTVVEAKHPMYRALFGQLEGFNLKKRSQIKTKKWLSSVLDEIRGGKLKDEKASRKASILRAKETLENNRYIRKFKQAMHLLEPKAPVTEDDIILAGNLDVETGYKVMLRNGGEGPSKEFMQIITPIAKPIALYELGNFYEVPEPRHGRISAPSYIFSTDADSEYVKRMKERQMTRHAHREKERLDLTLQHNLMGTAENIFMNRHTPTAWLERLASYYSRTATEKAVKDVQNQVPLIAKLRTKHPTPTTSKYATFSRRPLEFMNGRKESGYTPMVAVISQRVTTAINAQYGRFIVMSKASVAPVKGKNGENIFKSFQPSDSARLGRSYSDLVSALNKRMPPTIISSARVHEMLQEERKLEKEEVKGSLEQELEKGILTRQQHDARWQKYLQTKFNRPTDDTSLRHYHGKNRESQTGEWSDVGFRTCAAAPSLKILADFDATEFVPSSDVAVSNTPGIRGAVTTRAGPDYPFCVPSTRTLSLLDRLHVLICDDSFSNEPCCFTALGRQDPGQFLVRNNTKVPLGTLEMRIYRSFAYFQFPHIEQYTTSEGIPYWYNRRTGETYWEAPLVESVDESRPFIEEDVRVLTKSERLKYSETLGPKRKPPNQRQMRQHLLKEYEELPSDHVVQSLGDEKYGTKSMNAKFSREVAKADQKRIQEKVGQTAVMRGTEPLQEASSSRSERCRASQKNQVQFQAQVVEEPSAPKNVQKEEEEESTHKNENDELISKIQSALHSVMSSQGKDSSISSDDFLKLGVGLGLGIGLGQKQTQEKVSDTQAPASEEQNEGAENRSKALKIDVEDSHSSSSGGESEDDLIGKTPRHIGPFTVEPTPTPDEREALKPDEEIEPRLDEKEHETHEPAGEGKYWTARGTAKVKLGARIVTSSVSLPEGFVNSVNKPHTAKQHADYLPSLPNLNEARSVGVVKPRNILKDWSHAGFDPWSAGKDKVTTSFVPSLFIDETTGEDNHPGEFADYGGIAERREKAQDEAKRDEEREKIFSLCRHGKYEEIEEYFQDPDTDFPIDTKDPLGNTLLSIAAQNGNKRIAKLCLRRGADINIQNLNGQTVLHYCLAYEFEALAGYFLQKGADDSLLNADGLTCYEGLSLEDIENI